jgi:hypothetical protein
MIEIDLVCGLDGRGKPPCKSQRDESKEFSIHASEPTKEEDRRGQAGVFFGGRENPFIITRCNPPINR